MGILGKPALYLYWTTREILLTLIFSKTITRDSFKEILWYLHFCNNNNRPPREADNHDPLFKIRQYHNKVTSAFQHVFTPGEYVSVDEGMIRFFARLSFKTYNPQKPAKYATSLVTQGVFSSTQKDRGKKMLRRGKRRGR